MPDSLNQQMLPEFSVASVPVHIPSSWIAIYNFTQYTFTFNQDGALTNPILGSINGPLDLLNHDEILFLEFNDVGDLVVESYGVSG